MAGRIGRTDSTQAYDHRLAFGTWVNDMRNEALPLQQWPAPQFDDATVEGLTRVLDVMADSGYQCLDTFGWFATESYPLDIVSAFDDAERNRNIAKVFRAAAKRDLRLTLPLGLMTWGYDRIIREDSSVRGKDQDGNPHAHAMCGAQEKSWSYIEKLIDTMFARLDFGAVHLESADLGYCACPECGGKYGSAGYNARLNARAADYIKQKHPEVLVYVCPISWVPFALNADGVQIKISSDDLPHIIELSKHIDIFMDQGHHGRMLNWEDVPRLHCAYGTSGGLWVYHGARQDRLSYCLPYPKRAAQHLKDHYDHGTRGCLYYQGPMINPAVEVNSAVAGRVMCDPARQPEEVLEEVIEAYYRPRRAASRRKLAEILVGIEDAYFGQWQEARFKEMYKVEAPGEFCLGGLFGTTPDAAAFLAEPFLDSAGRGACMAGLKRALADLAAIRDDFRDDGRVERLIRSCTVMAHLLATTMNAKGEPWDN